MTPRTILRDGAIVLVFVSFFSGVVMELNACLGELDPSVQARTFFGGWACILLALVLAIVLVSRREE